ncbi:MAG: hypothetical protein HY860_01370 [Chlamydiales bacterium]|nr:hypothetical protein [Chlamydiales bacterium]
MFRKFFFSIFAVTAGIYADQQIKTPEQVQQELNQAENDFNVAKEMFIPYYTGPLITSSANNVPMGHINIQPYLYFNINYASFNDHRHSVSMSTAYVLNPVFVFQFGILNWLDATIIPQGFFKWQNGNSAQNFGDTSLSFGLQLLKETPYAPSIRMVLGEIFPTGKYNHLSASKGGLDSTGGGAFVSSVGLNISKIFWWMPLHPVAMRLTSNYQFADHRVSVDSFNSYGGGFGTDGKIKVGNTVNADLGVEVSLTQKWVFATDLVYTYSSKSTFTGTPGVTSTGSTASNGTPPSDSLSIAPAIEYNVTDSGGFIGGIWLPITGRNSTNFVSIVLSYTQLF